MQIFTEEEKYQTILEVRIEYLELAMNYYETNNLLDLAPNDIMHGEDIFSNPVANYFQENSNQNDDDDIINPSRKSDYSILAKLASKYLAIPTILVPSECLFSSAGLTIMEKRTSLNSQFVESILLLKLALKIWPVSYIFN
ncbi:6071_t:CDS:2 [Scutellospora calospora]|uniref:6071_t:CDS:1 n=1 Tax=Scutellospora calospora TaxID=85575 RepID=A0ACA9KA62_9GLOM|nr:6071_t:CDS:2 [Scutellospora calospora]